MNISKSNTIVIQKILKEISIVNDITKRYTKEEFLVDDIAQRAAAMTIINIGELTTIFAEDFRQKYPQIPWRKIKGLRNIMAHKYEIIDFEDVWETAIASIPQLERHLREILTAAF
ncbi:MAG: HepT-like ribonuclease domain-containing protein [Sedimentisphaerales bacterium]